MFFSLLYFKLSKKVLNIQKPPSVFTNHIRLVLFYIKPHMVNCQEYTNHIWYNSAKLTKESCWNYAKILLSETARHSWGQRKNAKGNCGSAQHDLSVLQRIRARCAGHTEPPYKNSCALLQHLCGLPFGTYGRAESAEIKFNARVRISLLTALGRYCIIN